MRNLALIAVLAATPLAACAAGYYGPAGPGPIAYDGFYDDYYGPVYDGYWGDRDVFYYRTGDHGRFRPDRGGHFRRGGGAMPGGFHEFHGSMTPPAGHVGGRTGGGHMGGGHHH